MIPVDKKQLQTNATTLVVPYVMYVHLGPPNCISDDVGNWKIVLQCFTATVVFGIAHNL
jgi:hypothetical protein